MYICSTQNETNTKNYEKSKRIIKSYRQTRAKANGWNYNNDRMYNLKYINRTSRISITIYKQTIMKTLRIKKTVYPPITVKSYNEWSMWFWGLYSQSIEKSKNDWSRNEYKPKNK